MTTHHFFSPHRDDALLTFGGHILNLISKKDPVIVHIIFGQDGYIRPLFLAELKKQRVKHPHLKKLIPDSGLKSENYENIIDTYLHENSQKSLLELGILIRRLEEKTIAHEIGYDLKEYDFPCGFPLRGYKRFNEALSEDDYTTQLHTLLNGSHDLKQLLEPNNIKQSDDVRLYFPSGIGGHPDHVILTRIGMGISLKYPDKVIFGQDLPYSLVQEWFCKSPLPFENMEKCVIDINQSLKDKIRLLSLYESQLSKEDIRLAETYPKYVGDLISREYKLGGDFEHLTDKKIAIEIQYQFAHA